MESEPHSLCNHGALQGPIFLVACIKYMPEQPCPFQAPQEQGTLYTPITWSPRLSFTPQAAAGS